MKIAIEEGNISIRLRLGKPLSDKRGLPRTGGDCGDAERGVARPGGKCK